MTKQEAIARAGSRAALGRLLGISRRAVSKWIVIPPRRQLELAALKRKAGDADSKYWFRAGAQRG